MISYYITSYNITSHDVHSSSSYTTQHDMTLRQVKAAVEEYYMNSLVKECIDVTRELVHPMGMGDALKVQLIVETM